MSKSFTIEEIKNYLLSQDSRGDIFYNLSEENIIKAKTKAIVGKFGEISVCGICGKENCNGITTTAREECCDSCFNKHYLEVELNDISDYEY